jgi:hypothetical protein
MTATSEAPTTKPPQPQSESESEKRLQIELAEERLIRDNITTELKGLQLELHQARQDILAWKKNASTCNISLSACNDSQILSRPEHLEFWSRDEKARHHQSRPASHQRPESCRQSNGQELGLGERGENQQRDFYLQGL